MYSEFKNELTLPLAKANQNPIHESIKSKENTMSTKTTSCSLALVKDILDIIALKPEMFF